MECYGEAHVATLTHHKAKVKMELFQSDTGFVVKCDAYPEFEEVSLSKIRDEAITQFIEYFFAVVEMVSSDRQSRLPIN